MVKGHIDIYAELCKGCEICIAFCPEDVISISDQMNTGGYLPVILNETGTCTGCAICALVCPEAAIEVYRD